MVNKSAEPYKPCALCFSRPPDEAAASEATAFPQFDHKQKEELEEAKKGKRETKFKYSLRFVPLEFSRDMTVDEYVSTIQKWFHVDDLQSRILEAKEEHKGFLNQ